MEKTKRELNPEQKAAVETSEKTLLVSASAGTGKTFALCERILRHITEGGDISKYLIVTFTKAATFEMRTRLSKKLKSAYQEAKTREEKEHLYKQILALGSAKICTIDSFCYDIVKENFDLLGISPGVQIAEESALSKKKKQLMERALEEGYKGNRKKDFEHLCDALLGQYSDSDFAKILISIYGEINLFLEGIETLQKQKELLQNDSEKPFSEGEIGKEIQKRAEAHVRYCIHEYEKSICLLREDSDEKLLAEFLMEQTELKEALSYLEEGNYKRYVFAINHFEKGNMRFDSQKDEAKFQKWKRKHLIKTIDDKDCFMANFSVEEHQNSCKRLAKLHETLYELFKKYENDLWAYKLKYGLLEFSDLEKLTYQLFKNEEIAKNVASEFDEIFVDEYQDVNALQASIFDSLSRYNAFMVGDVKQSIYGFRGACPTFFSERRSAYPLYSEEGKEGKVYLKRNYRSTGNILNFCNLVAGKLLNLCSDMSYEKDDDLVFEEKENKSKEEKIKICVMQQSKEKEVREEEYLAKSVKMMIDKGRKPEDILILARSWKSDGEKVKKALENEGVNVDFNSMREFFSYPEILLLRSLLEMVNNPTKDVYLAGAMRSPVFGFTLEELSKIRMESKEESLFSALKSAYDKTGNPKCEKVLSFISEFREFSREASADEILWKVLEESRLLSISFFGESKEKGEKIKDNLLFFYDLAKSYSGSSRRELGSFLSYIDTLEKSDEPLGGTAEEPIKGCVRMLTIHKSKGLEAPVCWLYGCGKNSQLTKKDGILVDERFGVYMKLPDEKYPAIRFQNGVGCLIKKKAEDAILNEILRLIYVALTRPKEELYISASIGSTVIGDLQKYQVPGVLSRVMLLKNRQWIWYILMALEGNQQFSELYENGDLPSIPEIPKEEKTNPVLVKEEREEENTEDYEKEIEKRMDFVYPYEVSVKLPMKMSVSKVYDGVLDEEKWGGEVLLPETEEKNQEEERPVPLFYKEENMEDDPQRERIENGKLAALKGTATHSFMQFCNFENLETKGFDYEIRRLVEKRFLDEKTALLVNKKGVESFLDSPLYKEMKEAKQVYREQRFIMSMKAKDFSRSEKQKALLGEEDLLIQGVIDCFYVSKEGKTVLLDYKTDRRGRMTREEFRKELVRRHENQLYYYKKALEEMTGMQISHVLIYSFDLNESVPVVFTNTPDLTEILNETN